MFGLMSLTNPQFMLSYIVILWKLLFLWTLNIDCVTWVWAQLMEAFVSYHNFFFILLKFPRLYIIIVFINMLA